ncbi:nucleotidyltransferase family protein [Salinarimonas rosea]|uniref:nucleotidyltransferase family protein n=1 Tax=Salinarimonas rosea TaxID=552063 RepID=UPI0003FF9D83|nr:nucleotidyltransferase domain-containing protein [Salinarimonas rosea]
MSDAATGPIVTLPERKAREAGRRAAAVAAVSARLAAYARVHGGRYLVYGSAARGAMRHDSDLDLLVDFPAALHAEAWRFAEDACAQARLPADIRPLAWCTERFRAHVAADWVVLG